MSSDSRRVALEAEAKYMYTPKTAMHTTPSVRMFCFRLSSLDADVAIAPLPDLPPLLTASNSAALTKGWQLQLLCFV